MLNDVEIRVALAAALSMKTGQPVSWHQVEVSAGGEVVAEPNLRAVVVKEEGE